MSRFAFASVTGHFPRFPVAFAVIPFALVTACSHPDCPPPGVRVEYQDRVVETQRECQVKKPARPKPIATLPTDAVALAAVLGAKLAEYSAPGKYADKMESALDSCTQEAQ